MGPTSHASYPSRGRGGCPFFSQSCLICQVCQKPGHVALDCYHRFDDSFQKDATSNVQAYVAAPHHSGDPN